MRQFVFIVLCFLCLVGQVSALSSQPNPSQAPTVELKSTHISYDFGEVASNSVITETIAIKNRLRNALMIREAHSSCECVEVSFVPQMVERNGTITLVITLDTTGLTGDEKSAIYLLTDDAVYEVVSLEIHWYTPE